MRVAGFTLALVGLVSLIACSSGERLTVEQYAEFCAGGVASVTDLIEPDRVTWGDLARLGERSGEQLRSVSPPEALADFHRASLKAVDHVSDTAADQPPDQPANPLAFGFEAIRIATQLRRAIEALPIDVRRVLDESGCL